MRVTAGEMVNISRPDVMSGMVEELTALRAEVRLLRQENKAHSLALIKSSQRAESNSGYLERWEKIGIPKERTA